MRLGTITSTAVLLATLAGCSPYLRHAKPDEKSFKTNVRCTQGPLVLRTKALGTRWGEYLTLRAYAPRALVGRYRVLVDGQLHSSGDFRTSRVLREYDGRTTLVPDNAPENQRCVERPPEVPPNWSEPPPAQASPPPPSWPAQPVPQPVYVPPAQPAYEAPAYSPPEPEWQPMPQPAVVAAEPAPEPGWTPPPAPEPPMPVIEAGALVEIPQPNVYPAVHEATIVGWAYENRSLENLRFPTAGADVAIEIWSEQPNDYEDAVFAFEQGAYEPSAPEPEWIAYLKEREEERRRENEEWQREQREFWERERKKLAEQHAWCLAHRDDEDCWGPEGTETAEARERARASAPVPSAPRPAPVPQVAAAPQPRPPQEPPPPPKQDVPPRPTPGAEWIPGYWEWTGFEWAWLDGWWKVPEPERRQAIAAAPTPPPAVRVEVRPAAPAVIGVVWRAGEWIWGGRGWIWLPGGWWRSQPRHAPGPAPVHRAEPAAHPAAPAR